MNFFLVIVACACLFLRFECYMFHQRQILSATFVIHAFSRPHAIRKLSAKKLTAEDRGGDIEVLFSRPHAIRKLSAKKLTAEDRGGDIEVLFRGVSFHARYGETLRSAMLRNGVSPHNGASKEICCRGLGTCGTCSVEIVSRHHLIEPATLTNIEEKRLRFPPHGQFNNSKRLRLSCQIKLSEASDGGVTERKLVLAKYAGFWGEKREISNESADEFRMPLGSVELILDRNKKL